MDKYKSSIQAAHPTSAFLLQTVQATNEINCY